MSTTENEKPRPPSILKKTDMIRLILFPLLDMKTLCKLSQLSKYTNLLVNASKNNGKKGNHLMITITI